MKPHRILKTFNGSQTGNDNDTFVEGTIRDLSTSLAAVVVAEGWAEPFTETRDPKVVVKVVEETKVEAPAEVKAEEPKKKLGGKKKA